MRTLEEKRHIAKLSARKRRIEDPQRVKAIKKEYLLRNKERLYAENKIYREQNKQILKEKGIETRKTMNYKFSAWKRSAKKRQIEWGLTIEYLLNIPLVCHYSGVELTMEANKSNTISLDRLDSNKGYVQGNVVFCTAPINFAKRDLSVSEFIDMCKKVANSVVS